MRMKPCSIEIVFISICRHHNLLRRQLMQNSTDADGQMKEGQDDYNQAEIEQDMCVPDRRLYRTTDAEVFTDFSLW